MNEREELLKKLNDEFEEKKEELNDVTPYKATANLNTSLSNPNMNINDNMSVNIQENVNSTVSTDALLQHETTENTQTIQEEQPTTENNQGEVVDQNVDQNVEQEVENEQQIQVNNSLDVTEQYYEDQPVYDMQTNYTTTYISNQEMPKEKKKFSLKISKDMMVLLIAFLIILIFILILPVVSDLVKNIKNN